MTEEIANSKGAVTEETANCYNCSNSQLSEMSRASQVFSVHKSHSIISVGFLYRVLVGSVRDKVYI